MMKFSKKEKKIIQGDWVKELTDIVKKYCKNDYPVTLEKNNIYIGKKKNIKITVSFTGMK